MVLEIGEEAMAVLFFGPMKSRMVGRAEKGSLLLLLKMVYSSS